MRILIADDNRDAADGLAILLRMHGYDVRVCYDGMSASELALTFHPHVAVLDIGMPRMNGYELARALRAAPGTTIRLVALTGWGQPEDRRRVSEAGFDHHLVKPAEPDTLERLLAGVAEEVSGGSR